MNSQLKIKDSTIEQLKEDKDGLKNSVDMLYQNQGQIQGKNNLLKDQISHFQRERVEHLRQIDELSRGNTALQIPNYSSGSMISQVPKEEF